MPKKSKKEEKKEDPTDVQAMFVKLNGLGDLARSALTLSEITRPVFAVKTKSGYTLLSPGIKLGDARVVFFLEQKKVDSVLVYHPADAQSREVLEFKNVGGSRTPGMTIQYIPVIEVEKNPYGVRKDKPKVINVQLKDYKTLAKSAITKATEANMLGRVYSFKYKGKSYIGSFTILDDDKTFCYAEGNTKGAKFLRYSYATEELEPTDTFGDHTYLYLTVVNLAEPFPFFRPD